MRDVSSVDLQQDSQQALELLAALIREPSVNRGSFEVSDGDESRCATILADYFRDHGLEPEILDSAPKRSNVIARLKGTGELPPLLLGAHLDVVEAEAEHWQRAPFAAEIAGDYLWGRGALDMKNMAAMCAVVMARLAREQVTLKRDIIFAGCADEEAGCRRGSLWLVEEHADKVRAEVMLGEVGAFSLDLFGKSFYPIQVAEKGLVWSKVTYKGPPGHGSMPNPDSAVHRLARGIARLGKKRFPTHPTEVVRGFLEGLAGALPRVQATILRQLSLPQASGLILDYLVRDEAQRRSFGAMLANTASPTVVRAGQKINVIPGEASVEIDGRVLPGQSTEDFLRELRELLDDDALEIEVLHAMPPVETPLNDFERLASILRRHHPESEPLPYLMPGFTDAKAYAKLGTRCYGFSPVRFDPSHQVQFTKLYHGHDERVPVDGFHWGFRVLFDAVCELAL